MVVHAAVLVAVLGCFLALKGNGITVVDEIPQLLGSA